MFLDRTDLENLILSEDLDVLVENRPNALDEAIEYAVSCAKNALSHRYDVNTIFDIVVDHGNDQRPKDIVFQLVNIALYQLHIALAPRQIPEHRIELHDRALEYLQKYNSDGVLPRMTDSETGEIKPLVRMGSVTKQRSNF